MVTLTLLKINTSRDDVYCPGDTISYNCSIISNTERPHLIWNITLPGQTPTIFIYDSISTLYDIHHLNTNITVTLTKLDTIATTEFVNKEHIESIIVITVLKNVSMNGTELECSIADLDSDSAVVFVNTSGMTVTTMKPEGGKLMMCMYSISYNHCLYQVLKMIWLVLDLAL